MYIKIHNISLNKKKPHQIIYQIFSLQYLNTKK